jgi:hypothetical protein
VTPRQGGVFVISPTLVFLVRKEAALAVATVTARECVTAIQGNAIATLLTLDWVVKRRSVHQTIAITS